MIRLLIFFFITYLLGIQGHAQGPLSIEKLNYIRFLKLSIDDGLADNSCKVIFKDSFGFLWFGTLDGLSKYDGYNFTNYSNNPSDTLTISNNYITTIIEDQMNNLWIGTNGGGVNFYDRKLDKITRRYTSYSKNINQKIRSNIIHSLYISNEELWIGTENGSLQKISLITNDVIPIATDDLPASIYKIVKGKDGNIWVVNNSPGSISLINPSSMQILNRWDDFDNSGYSINQHIKKVIFPVSDSIFWLGTEGEGVYKINYNKQAGTLTPVKHFCTQNGNLGHNIVTGIVKDAEQNIWVSTDGGGVNIIDSGEESYVQLLRLENDRFSLSTNAIYEIYQDYEGNIWLGTFTGGINYFYAKTQKFIHYRKKNYPNSSLSYNQIITVAKNSDGKLIIGTDGGGLSVFNPSVLKFENWEEFSIPEFKIVKSIFQDQMGNYWVGTYGFGLYKFDSNRKLIRIYRNNLSDSTSLSHNSVWRIFQDSSGNIWAGTLGGGLCLYQNDTDDFIRFSSNPQQNNSLSNNIVRAISEDRNGNIWVGTPFGLNKIDSNHVIIKYYHSLKPGSLSNSDIRCITVDSKGQVLIGTKGGINIFNEKSESFKFYGKSDGLPGDAIYDIEEDQEGNYWVATSNKGLSKITIKKDTGSVNLTVRNFDKNDGLQSNQFMYASATKTQDGLLFFGGVEGFNFFDPKEINVKYDQVSVVFTNLFVANNQINQFNDNNFLSKHISVADEIKLPYGQNMFSIHYSALDFNQSRDTWYTVKLEGFNKDWQPPTTQHSANYTNLDHGRYIFKVKAMNQDGLWSDEVASIVIKIIPPWYMTSWAKMAFILLALTLIIGTIRYRINRLHKQKKALQFLVEDQTEELKNANILLQSNHQKITDQNNDLKANIKYIGDQQKKIELQNAELIKAQMELDIANKNLTDINQTLEERVRKRTRELEKSNEELDRFVYSASHDISAPLKSLMGLITLSRRDHKLENIMSYLNHMEQSVHRLDDVITTLIQYSQNTKKKILKSRFRVRTVIEDVIHSLSFLNNANDTIEFEVNVPAETEILFDETRFRIIVNNLISNSIKYHNFRQDRPFIKVGFTIDDNFGKLEVKDNGIGISDALKDNIFNMFFRATSLSTGAGLGLFIVKETVDKLKGKINIDSIEGKGTTVNVKVPLI